jgi:peroxiredoxin
MKKYFLFIALLPLISIAQVKSKTAVKSKTVKTKVNIAKPDGFQVNGNITGYPDGTVVDLLNGNTGVPETSGKVEKGKFILSGKLEFPDFKLIAFNKAAPYITLFLDNSVVNITGKKDALDQAVVKGSPTHDEFTEFNKITKPHEKLFSQAENTDSVTVKKVAAQLEAFSRKRPGSYVSPLAIYRNHQLTEDTDLMEELYGKLQPEIRSSPIGNYIAQQIAEARKNPIGKPLADFSQEDTTGNMVSLSSLRGKYVLIDFWASWCGPCRQENPNVVNAFNKYKSKNFTVLGVSLDKTKQPWLDAIKKDNLTWTQLSDLKGWNNGVAQQFQIQSIPQNFLVDPAGIVIGKNLRGAALESKLEAVLKN